MRPLPSAGMLALAAFAICAGSGVVIGLVFDPAHGQDSLALVLLHNPLASVARAVHWWSAQAFVVLGLVHVVQHVLALKRGPSRLPSGVWLRSSLALVPAAWAMLSGFILRGDEAAQQAARALDGVLRSLPLVGDALSLLLLGPGGGAATVYLHHVATSTILVWLAVAEHARRALPERAALAWMLLLSIPPALLLGPDLGAGPAAADHAPWWLAGGQEALRWLPHPTLAVAAALAALAALAWLPHATGRRAAAMRLGLGAAAVVYAGLSLVAWSRSIPEGIGLRRTVTTLAGAPAAPLVRGRREGCMACHAGLGGMAAAHDPAVIGCAVCHGGDRFSLDAATAHAGMTRSPGDLAALPRSCATAGCHEAIAARVEGSLMNTMSGVVAVDRWVFGEAPHPDTSCDVRRLGRSPADDHLRQLCASCHLGQPKDGPGPITESSRGGGCSACHLRYDGAAGVELAARLQGRRALPTAHPAISVDVPAIACFGCHSRSGRISTSYEGWAEVAPGAEPRAGVATRRLDDGRLFERMPADVHHERGMNCIDCHIASEVMGDGRNHIHQEQAGRIACADCHTDHPATTATPDAEGAVVTALRGHAAAGRRFLRTASGEIYTNVWQSGDGQSLELHPKSGGGTLHPRPPSAACGRDLPGHQRVDCRTCHSAWTSQCITCHTAYDPAATAWDHLAQREVTGAWIEAGHAYRAEPPVLGVRTTTDGPRIVPTAPGMIMTIAGRGADAFRRLHAPVAPHTTVSAARSCASCHADPLALGYGRGRLDYEVADGRGTWRFAPALAAAADGLPADAWIPFLGTRVGPTATRSDLAPLDVAGQRRMLLVGSCLHCHDPGEERLRAVFADWPGWRRRVGAACALPAWEAR